MKMNFVIHHANGEKVRVPIEGDEIEIMHINSEAVLAVRNGQITRIWPLTSNELPWWLKGKEQKVKDSKRRRGKFIGRFQTQGGLSHSDILERTRGPA